jgi:beta-phosphoglucomutase-like phosphatase (HAD superfamily)
MKQAIKQYLERHGFEALRLKTVLFDMDGVLYDSMKNHATAWQQSMAKFGITMSKADAYATEGARGVDTIRMMVKRQQGRDIDEREAQLMYDEKTRIFHSLPETQVMHGIIPLMEQLSALHIIIGVVTGSGQRPLINRLLTDFKGYLSEDHITTAYDIKRGKPNPDPYLMGLQKAGNLHPWEGMVVENAPLGVQAGVAAQIFTIAVNTGPLPDSELLQHGANLLFKKMPDLNEAWPSIYRSLL